MRTILGAILRAIITLVDIHVQAVNLKKESLLIKDH